MQSTDGSIPSLHVVS